MDSTSTSFWDRRPWLGAVLFAIVVSGVGVFLAIQVGERPHLRSTWSLVTEVHRGTYDKDAPWRDDPVRVVVRVRTHNADYEPIVGAQAVLVARGTQVISRGFTAPPEGHIHLPVPERFSQALFNKEVSVAVVVPGGATQWAEIPTPKEGLAFLQVALQGTRSIQVSVADDDSPIVDTRGRVIPIGPDGLAPAFSVPWPIDRGTALISGARADAPLVLEVRLVGHETTRTPLAPGQVSVKVPPGAALARLSLVLHDAQGAPLGNQTVRLRPEYASGPRPSQLLRTDSEGHLWADLQPGEEVHVIVTGRDGKRGAVLKSPGLEPGARWEPEPVRIVDFPVLLRGRVLGQDGTPAKGAMVTVRPWGRAGRVETTRTHAETGVFELRGAPFTEPVLVTAFHEGLAGRLQEPVDAAAQTELSLRMAEPGRLSGKVDAVAGFIEKGVTVSVVLPGVRDAAAALHATHAERDGRFELVGVAAGTYDVLVVAHGAEPRVIDGVQVGAGTSADDARLATIRLR